MPGTFVPLKVHINAQRFMHIHQEASQTRKDTKTSQAIIFFPLSEAGEYSCFSHRKMGVIYENSVNQYQFLFIHRLLKICHDCNSINGGN
jgi:hypothetical protein